MKLSEKQAQFLLDASVLVQFINRLPDAYCTGGELHRPKEMQQIYFDQGLSKTTDGQHPKRLAIDLFIFYLGDVQWGGDLYEKAGEFWKSIREENRWGGDFEEPYDPYHFERADDPGKDETMGVP